MGRRDLPVVPVVGDTHFRFPYPQFYQDLKKDAIDMGFSADDTSDLLCRYVATLFKTIAVVFQPHGSNALLQAQAGETLKKVQGLGKMRSATPMMPMTPASPMNPIAGGDVTDRESSRHSSESI